VFRRLAALSALCVAAGALSATAPADPGKSRVFEKVGPIPFVLTPSEDGAFNPCVADEDLADLVVWGTLEIFDHTFERANGSHSNLSFYVTSTDNFGFVLLGKMVGPDVINVNENNGVMTLSSIGQFQIQNPETKQRYKFYASLHVTDVRGANIVTVEQFGFSECLGPEANGA